MLKQISAIVFVLGMLPGFASAQSVDEDTEIYIRANTIFFLYHEFGHALIDLLQLPVFGQEEDAADVLGVVLSEKITDPEDAETIMLAAADNFAYMAQYAAEDGAANLAFWDTHDLDMQRYFTILCLYYGADPSVRQAIASDQELPEERQQTCPEEWELAEASWGPVLEDIEQQGQNSSWLSFNVSEKPSNPEQEIVLDAMRIEAEALGELFDPGTDLQMTFEFCGEANAFYDPNRKEIVICAELAELFVE